MRQQTALSAVVQYLLQTMPVPLVFCILTLSKIWVMARLEASVTNLKYLNTCVVLEERKKGWEFRARDITFSFGR